MRYEVISRWVRRPAVVLTGLAVVACVSRPLPDLGHLPQAPADYPAAALVKPGGTLMEVTSGVIRVTVGREGTMARLGHDHLISGPVYGRFRRSGDSVSADLFVPVGQLVVDDPQERARLGGQFAKAVPDKDREGTRANLLSDAVLSATRYGFIRAIIDGIVDDGGRVDATFELAGRRSARQIQVEIHSEAACDARYAGQFQLRHADFGLQPFAAIGGALRVSESISVQFELQARAATCDM